ncbi:Capsular exopolysaccharide family protein [Desulfonema limicola]|uniref:Capsular exopolysaccharide family protein n=1 Tax=Desulfonema limicola TaxID=45656 RepID=A0A975GFB9_9BACT|nr:CpsD/CapB family tyrosine-protein kinase [Desulfonema limicola]QTA79092.1 Capsular exopolysaccharide family protein [Desulfonema limicola]
MNQVGIFRKTYKNKKLKNKQDNLLEGDKYPLKESKIEFNGLLDLRQKNLFEVDQLKKLRTRLLFPAKGRIPRSVAVTSAGIGEGKTFVSANLAVSIAQNIDNRQTFLLDCDLSRPSIHSLFGFEDLPGLAEYLAGNAPLAEYLLKPLAINQLTILPGGTPPYNPSELLSSKKMSDLLEEALSRYDDRYIVIDLPSPLLVPETGLIINHVDGVIIVLHYGKTLKSSLKELINIIGKDNVLGVVFNHFDTSMHSFFYRMYRKYVRRK